MKKLIMKLKENIILTFAKVATNSYIPLGTRIVNLLFFILLIALLFFGTVNIFTYHFTSKIAMFVVWVLWWPFLYITLFFIGRLWCGFLCPLSLANEFGNMIRKGRGINYRKWAFVPFVLFFLIVYIEQVSGLFLSTFVTLTFFVLFFLLAFFMGMALSRFAFCKLVCPIGVILGVFSRISILGLRTKKEVCAICPKKLCILGGKTKPCPVFLNVPAIKSNKDCLLCANCIKNCPYGAANIGFVKPGKELYDRIDFTLSESLFIIALLGMGFILTTNGTSLIRIISLAVVPGISGSLLRGMDFIISVGLFIGIFYLLSYVTAYMTKMKTKVVLSEKTKTIASEAGYYFLPFVFFIMFVTISFGFLGPWLPINEDMIIIFKLFFVLIGALWSISLITNMRKTARAPFFIFLGILVILWAGILITDPLHIVTQEDKVVYVEQGQVIPMSSFSMGFDPNIIVVEQGTEVILNVTNIDVMHAFDMDTLNVHYILFTGDNIIIRFTPQQIGVFTFTCNIPGHTEAGMKGKLIVVEDIDAYRKDILKG